MPEEKEVEVPKPTKEKEEKEPRIVVVEKLPTIETREGNLGDEEVICETQEEAIAAIRNDVREIRRTLG